MFLAEKNVIYLSVAIISAALMSLASCRSAQEATAMPDADSVQVSGVMRLPRAGGANALPKAVVYRTNGDYAQNVPVNLNPMRDSLLSYPAPSDITDSSSPLEVGDGWLLDRRGGVGANTAFLKYTYAQYRALPQVDASMLMDAILPDARVTEVRVLPVSASEAILDPEIVTRYINGEK